MRDVSALSVASEQFEAEAAVLAEKLEQRAHEPLEKHPTAMLEKFTARACLLEGCVFVGHTNTDMDSVAAAIAAAGAGVLRGAEEARSTRSMGTSKATSKRRFGAFEKVSEPSRRR